MALGNEVYGMAILSEQLQQLARHLQGLFSWLIRVRIGADGNRLAFIAWFLPLLKGKRSFQAVLPGIIISR